MPRRSVATAYAIRRRWRVDDARAALATQAASGLSAKDFARREGFDVARLYRWRHQLSAEVRGRQPAAEFIEIRPRDAERVEIVLTSGRVLRVSETIDVAALARIIAALETSGC